MTMNSPDSLLALFRLATENTDVANAVYVAELMREVGLKCISFNGVRLHRTAAARSAASR